ncbi:MAG: NAD+ synthase [bacterium]|jgi:NAD+ synthase (glutamine-hydrolysing)|nr:NAD+ synthase [bacterium]MDD3805618.1 NAD+ synthase [bacterium]MDD4557657.1 NAD+ synthase [bacterium]
MTISDDKIIRLAVAQINPTVGDIEGNLNLIISNMRRAAEAGAELIVFPELALTGYPPEDLLFKEAFIKDNLAALQKAAVAAKGIAAIVGFIDRRDDIFNAAALLHDGTTAGIYHKHFLSDRSGFDESRYFGAGQKDLIFSLHGLKLGVTISEDILYPTESLLGLAGKGVEMVVNIAASPYYLRKAPQHEKLLSVRASDYLMPILYVNLVGGQDGLVFDGMSAVFDECGNLLDRAAAFAEDLRFVDVDLSGIRYQRLRKSCRHQLRFPKPEATDGIIHLRGLQAGVKSPKVIRKPALPLQDMEEIRRALCLGLHDYVHKNGFKTVVIGLSGGIDSALVTVLAVEALGAKSVKCINMPSRFSAEISRQSAAELCSNLGIEMLALSIDGIMGSYLTELAPVFAGLPSNITEENIQARIRGNLLYALSNKFGWLVLATGNKSEMSIGYSTLYGDMAGGLAVIKDLSKTMVYSLSRHINRESEIIPEIIITRPPSAELRPGQLDTDSLPPYDILDPILKAYIEDELSVEEITFAPRELVVRVAAMVDRNEYKRRQAPPGIKVTVRTLGRDRRYPITNHYS